MLYALVAGLALAAAWRIHRIRSMERFSLRKRTMGPNGIAAGAESIELTQGGAPAVLIIHGGGDTPQSVRYLAEFLHARGFSVSVPLLPGHGRSLRDFARVSADELFDAVRARYDELRARNEWVALIGVSMGGALAVSVAARRDDVPALVLLAPYLSMPRRIERAAMTSHVWGFVTPFVRSADGVSIRDPAEEAQNLAYGVFSAAALRALLRIARRGMEALPRVTAPTLVVQSREDNRVSVEATEQAFARLGAAVKRLIWVSGASHIITVDVGRERVFDEVAGWFEAHR